MTDIILDQGADRDWIKFEAQALNAEVAMVMVGGSIDSSREETWRRALAWGSGDSLSVNHKNDYPGGLRLNGVKTISGHMPKDFVPGAFAEPGEMVPTVRFEGAVMIEMSPGSSFSASGEPDDHKLTYLQLYLTGLQTQIDRLAGEVAELRARLGG